VRDSLQVVQKQALFPINLPLLSGYHPTASLFMIEPPILATAILFEAQSAAGEGQLVEPELQGGVGE
jgi:hypothetical protein